MSDPRPVPLSRAFVPSNTPMFVDLIAALEKDDQLSATRCRDMISGLRRVAKALGLPPSDVPCDGRWLQPRLAKIMPVAHGLTAKSWQNAVSDARAAMAYFGIVERRFRRIGDLSDAWQRLWDHVLASGDPTLAPTLCRFVHFLNRAGVAPDGVAPEHALGYRTALEANEISKSPDVAYRAAVNGWNLAARRLADWPQIQLPLERRQRVFRLAEAELAPSFIADLDSLLDHLASPDPLADQGPTRALRPATCAQYRRQIVRFASELVHSGVPAGEVTSLRTLIDPAMAERGLRQMLSRNDNQTSKSIGETAALLRNLGRLLGSLDDARKELSRLAKRLMPPKQQGMTRKNRERLRVLQDDRPQQRLLGLPDRIFGRALGTDRHYGKLLAREDALAIAILLACPLRISSLAALNLQTHVQRPGNGRVYLVLDEEDTKTHRALEFELPKDVVRLLDKHLATRSPELCPHGSPWLFPRRDDRGPIDGNALSSRLRKRLRKEIGLEMNAHLFRHFAVMIWLDANPGGYEVARRLLGHSELSHTIALYSGFEAASATRAFADLMATKQRRRP